MGFGKRAFENQQKPVFSRHFLPNLAISCRILPRNLAVFRSQKYFGGSLMRLSRVLRAAAFGGSDGFAVLDEWLQQHAQAEREAEALARARAHGVHTGAYEWYSLFRPYELLDVLEDENGLIDGKPAWVWRRMDRLEIYHRKPKAQRPQCGARCRSGKPCAARVVEREDGSLAKRCRMHGGTSTGPRSKKGRAAVAASNRRRAQLAREAKATAST
jgi:hypothetical protein